MPSKVKLELKEKRNLTNPYWVTKVNNSIEWSIGESLSKKQVDEILSRRGNQSVEVIIK